jgi:4-alpha-glucanotransferase
MIIVDDANEPDEAYDAAVPNAPGTPNARYDLHLRIPELANPPQKRCLPVIAEDLGVITPDVRALMRDHNLPGMKVLQFGFSGALTNPHAPFNHERRAVVYSGTHDNAPTNGWYAAATDAERSMLAAYAGHAIHPDGAHRALMRMALASPAETAIFPVQDVLGPGMDSRMNMPSTASGNWLWRMKPEYMDLRCYLELKELTRLYGRME